MTPGADPGFWKGGGGVICIMVRGFALLILLYPRYEVYRGYIVFAFSVIMFVCLSVNFFFRQRFLSNYLG